jgi:hypothetical protein
MKRTCLLVAVAILALSDKAYGTERYFGYSYEPETMPAGTMEFEQWVTLRTQRTSNVGQQNYNKWELREELEYGVTDRYTFGFYLNAKDEHFTGGGKGFEFDGISLENRYLVLNPAEHAIGLTLYLEPRFSGDEAEVEQKIIIGQRYGDWKWAANLGHATEWENSLHEVEGEVEGSFGLSRDLTKHFAIGVEVRDVNALPNYDRWEYTALYAGPVAMYHQDKWWASLSVMPQVYGKNYLGDPDGYHHLVLDEQERVNVRLLFGVSF